MNGAGCYPASIHWIVLGLPASDPPDQPGCMPKRDLAEWDTPVPIIPRHLPVFQYVTSHFCRHCFYVCASAAANAVNINNKLIMNATPVCRKQRGGKQISKQFLVPSIPMRVRINCMKVKICGMICRACRKKLFDASGQICIYLSGGNKAPTVVGVVS